jgi:pseudouridine 5'-phosphatase
VATSSGRRNFELKPNHLRALFGYFKGRIVCADDVGYEMKGKPNPDIFLTAARDMLGRPVGDNLPECGNVEREERGKGLVFEDAIFGMQAGKRAGMSGMCFKIPLGFQHR